MELKEYIAIVRKHIKWFWVTLFTFVFVAFVWQKSQTENIEATTLLNIGRAGTENTTDYTFDDFYRLQADERFADTVVRWLSSPRVVEDIFVASGMDAQNMGTRQLKNSFGAKRLSSQMVEVTFRDTNPKTLVEVSKSTVAVLNQYTESLNKDSKEANWFVVIGSEPVIRDARISFSFALGIGLVLGIFFGFWVTLLKHYFSENE